MRRLLPLLLVSLAACIPDRPKTLRNLHNELDEVASAQSAELPYRTRPFEVEVLRGMKKKAVADDLGPGECAPRNPGTRCSWRFFTQPDASTAQRPLWLRLDFDAKDTCTEARWAEDE